jgi:hypothetical protein
MDVSTENRPPRSPNTPGYGFWPGDDLDGQPADDNSWVDRLPGWCPTAWVPMTDRRRSLADIFLDGLYGVVLFPVMGLAALIFSIFCSLVLSPIQIVLALAMAVQHFFEKKFGTVKVPETDCR